MSHKTYFNWSSGKDAALAFHYLKQHSDYSIDRLLTTINKHHNRVSMHGLSNVMLQKQVASLQLPLSTIDLPKEPSMEEYDLATKKLVHELKQNGYTHGAFGDIFLEDLRKYREEQLTTLGIQCIFPLWKRNTTELIHEFIQLGFRAVVVCLNSALLDKSFLGREINASFVNDLPDGVDPCGENGEFHTYCFDGPIFDYPIEFTIGENIFQEYKKPSSDAAHDNSQTVGFWFCDLLPK